jgi:hypothetical protein
LVSAILLNGKLLTLITSLGRIVSYPAVRGDHCVGDWLNGCGKIFGKGILEEYF